MNQWIKTLSRYRYWIFGALVIGLLSQSYRRDDKRQTAPSSEQFFQTEIAQEAGPVLVKFGAEWCGPCKLMDKALDEYLALADGKVKVVHLDVEVHPAIASHYDVRAIPDTFVFHRGKVLGHQVGYMDGKEIQVWVEKQTSGLRDSK